MLVRRRKSKKSIGICNLRTSQLPGHCFVRAYARSNGAIGTCRFRFYFTPLPSGYNMGVIAYGYRDAELLPGFVAFDKKEQAKWKNQWGLCQ